MEMPKDIEELCRPSEHASVNRVRNGKLHAGYRWVEMAVDAPYRNTTEEQATDLTKKGGSEVEADGMNFSEYAIAGFQLKLITGRARMQFLHNMS